MFEYFEWNAVGYYFLYLFKLLARSGAMAAFLWAAVSLVFLVVVTFFLLLCIPRVVEDYVKIRNWYVNSDFYGIFEEKIDTGLFFKLAGLPFLLVFSLVFMILDLVVKTAYSLAAKLGLISCVNCHSYIEWKEEITKCRFCGEEFSGVPTKTCPACNFKPNSLRCPYCGFVVFIGLFGQPPSSRFRQDK
ncbi:MAG: hypothetical protein HQM08_15160 [Candidatus Riflebacteria bacterium]|nr:hypothetical protein [Candidatus Riflebacteria bacterium]